MTSIWVNKDALLLLIFMALLLRPRFLAVSTLLPAQVATSFSCFAFCGLSLEIVAFVLADGLSSAWLLFLELRGLLLLE